MLVGAPIHISITCRDHVGLTPYHTKRSFVHRLPKSLENFCAIKLYSSPLISELQSKAARIAGVDQPFLEGFSGECDNGGRGNGVQAIAVAERAGQGSAFGIRVAQHAPKSGDGFILDTLAARAGVFSLRHFDFFATADGASMARGGSWFPLPACL